MRTSVYALSILALFISRESSASEADACLSIESLRIAQACLNKISPFSRIQQASSGERVIASTVASIQGPYSQFTGSDPEQLRSPLLAKALENEGKHLRVNMGPVDPQRLSYDITLDTFTDGSAAYHGAMMASTYGPDVSGRDIATWYHRQRLGAGYVATVSATHGFSDLRPESKGGDYRSIFIDGEKAFVFGLANLSYSFTDNTAGGESLIYVLGGETHRYSASLANWLDESWKFTQKIEHTEREQDFGAFSIYTEQQYTSGVIEAAYEIPGIEISAKAKKGVSGSEKYDLIPLMGSFNPYYWSAEVQAKGQLQVADRLSIGGRFAAFKGDQEMPSSERIGLGGIGAGSSHESGLYTGYKGFQHNLAARYDLVRGSGYKLVAKAGVDGADVRTALDEELSLKSAEIGLEFHSHKWAIVTGYSKSIETTNLHDDQRLNAQLIWRY